VLRSLDHWYYPSSLRRRGGSDTTGDAPGTRCRDPAADSPPTDAKLFPKRLWPAYTIGWLPRDRFGLTGAPRNLSSAGSNATSPLCSAKPTASACNWRRQRKPRATYPAASRPTQPSRKRRRRSVDRNNDPILKQAQSQSIASCSDSMFPETETTSVPSRFHLPLGVLLTPDFA
jgi:hypothetical protein